MADTIHARAGDTLDALIARERGLGPGDLVTVLDANPGLARAGARLAIGTAVIVPAIPAPAGRVLPLIQLWS